ncbi:uncharacterized protein [Procambarus clarkii]|uniref:uncharacterized protein n=1 Tax=Procambarus clarkii TaxID=6728 RepID=UPI0037427143
MAMKVELEILLDDIFELENQRKITTKDTLQAELIVEEGKTRGRYKSTILTPELRAAAKSLRDNKDVVVRRGDKSPIYVILKRDEYIAKMNIILSDQTKFLRVTKHTTAELKTKVNTLIATVNAKKSGLHQPKITGKYKPSNAYGNVKTHKPGNPLRGQSTARYQLPRTSWLSDSARCWHPMYQVRLA